jgi:hypothetical protein
MLGSDPCIFDGRPPFSLVPSVIQELPIIATFLPGAITPPSLAVLLPLSELAVPNSLGALSSAHVMALPSLPAQMVSS